MNSITIQAPADRLKEFMRNPEHVLRLNPSWHIRRIEIAGNNRFTLRLYDDTTDQTSDFNLQVEVRENAICYIMNSMTIQFIVDGREPAMSRLAITGDLFRNQDLPYWMRGIRNYVLLQQKRSGAMKWFLDKVWLRMTPSQRRIAAIVIIAEGIGLLALIAVVLALKVIRG